MARAMWKAQLALGDVEIPVKLYAAVQDRDVHFRLLHAKDRVPVKQRMVDPRSGEEVAPEAVRRGVEIDSGLFVVLGDDDLAAAEPEASRTIEVRRFVPRAAIDLSFYARPYFLGPDGAQACADYFALAAAIGDGERVGVAHWVMRKKRSFGALVARGPHLALVTLRSADEVVAAGQLPQPGGSEIRAAERALAEQLVAALDAPFDPAQLRDEYRERVEALIEAKAAGRKPKLPKEAAPPKPSGDLAAVLKRSLAAAKESRRAA